MFIMLFLLLVITLLFYEFVKGDLERITRHWLLHAVYLVLCLIISGHLFASFGVPSLFRDDPELYGHGWYAIQNSPAMLGAIATTLILGIVWTFILLGASLAASLTTFNDRGGSWVWPASWEFLLAYRLLGHLWDAQRTGSGLSTEELLRREEGVTDTLMQKLLQQSHEAGLVTCDQQGDWLLSRDLDDVSLLDFYHSGHFHLPLGETPELHTKSRWDAPFLEALRNGDDQPLNLGLSLKSMFSTAGTQE